MGSFHLISDVSREIDRSQDTIRRWEREGLITPDRVGGRRIFSPADIRHLKEIRDRKARGRKGPRR